MKKSVAKSFILVLLIIASIYQIITLWFDDVSDRNFFYSFIDKVAVIIGEPLGEVDKEYMSAPRMLGVFIGASDKDFTIIEKKSSDYDMILSESMKAFSKVLSEGELEDVYEEEALWQSRGLIFSLSLPMSKDDLASDLDVSVATLGDLSLVRTMGIIPAKVKTDKIKVYFIDEQTNKVFVFVLEEKELRECNKKINSYINKMEGKGFPPYISSLKNDIELFGENVLLPLPTDNDLHYNSFSIKNPFITDENFANEDLENFVNGFFDNPNVKWTIKTSNGMIYGDDNALVKYSNNGVFEYSSILSNNDSLLDLSERFNVAESFLTNDILLSTQGYYLDSYIKRDGKTTFYYEYEYDGLPLFMEEFQQQTNNKYYPMEITIENGKVVKYKRVLIAINELEGQEVFNSQFEEALNSFVVRFNVRKGQLEDMYLGYVKKENKYELMWIIKYNGKAYLLGL